MRLVNATALVTGSNRGIGKALVQRLAAEPMREILAGMRSLPSSADQPTHAPSAADDSLRTARASATDQPGTSTQDERAASTHTPRPTIRPVHVDLSSRATIDACLHALADDLDRIDLLVNNAGLVTGGLLEEQDVGDIYDMFQVNLVAVVHLTHKVLPAMVKRGSGTIVNNASISGYAHFPAASTYAASKAGVVAFTESLRRELKGTGVHAMHVITPGVSTEMLQRTEDLYGAHLDVSGWESMPATQWAEKVVDAIKRDKRVLRPGGKSAAAKLLSHGPSRLLDAVTSRSFSRDPRH